MKKFNYLLKLTNRIVSVRIEIAGSEHQKSLHSELLLNFSRLVNGILVVRSYILVEGIFKETELSSSAWKSFSLE